MIRRLTAVLGLGLSLLTLTVPAHAEDKTVILDQTYVPDTYPLDPYAGATDGALHVSVSAGQETTHTLIHLGRPDVTSLFLVQTSSSGAPSLQACPVLQTYPPRVDPAKPPTFDCSTWSTPGKSSPNGTVVFDLTGHAVTGLAIVAKSPGITDSWETAFAPALTRVVVPVAAGPMPPVSGVPTSPSLPPVLTQPAPAVAQGPGPVGLLPATAPTPLLGDAPPVVPVTSPTVPTLAITDASVITRDRVPAWIWVVLALLAAACLGLGVALVQARRGSPETSTLMAWRTLRESPALTAATSLLLVLAFISSGFVGRDTTPSENQSLSQQPGYAGVTGPGTTGTSGSPTSGGPTVRPSGSQVGSTSGTTGVLIGGTGGSGGAGSGAGGGGPSTTNSKPTTCRWSCDIPYNGNGTTNYGPAPKPAGGNGGATATGVTATTIRLGVIGTNGSADFNGADATQGLKAFINKINQVEGGVYGRQIQLDYYSTNNDTPEGGVAAARQVIANDVGAVIINGVDGADAAGQVLGQAKVPFLSSQSSHAALASQPSVFTVTSPVEDHARGLVDYMARRLHAGPKLCFFVTNTNLWRSAVIPAMKDEAKKIGVQIPVIAETQETQTSFTAQLKQMQDSKCTGVGMFTVLEEVGIVRDAKTLNYKPIFSADEWTFDVLVQGSYGNSGPFDGMKVLRLIGTADEAGFADYQSDSKKYTGGNGLPDAAVHYAIAELAVEGLKRAGPHLTRGTMASGLLTLTNFSTKGILDKITYRANDRSGSHTVYVAQCCGSAADGTTRWKKLDGWRRFDSF